MRKILKKARKKFLYNPIDYIFGKFGYEVVSIGKLESRLSLQQQMLPDERFIPTDPNATFVNQRYLLTPRQTPLNIDDLLAFLKNKNLTGIIKRPLASNGIKLCIPSQLKEDTLGEIVNFCATEGAYLRYRVNGVTHRAKYLSDVLANFKFIDKATMKIVSLRSLDEIPFIIEFWKEHEEYYHAPGPNMISRRLWKTTATEHEIFKRGEFFSYSNILRYPHEVEPNFEIDLVFTWVNAEDEDWQNLYGQYVPQQKSDGNSKSRFHSRDELMYALRSWEQYAPFIRKIFVVSNCKPPAWLNLNNERITWVPHEDILPSSALPTFSSHAIETSLHKIPGLSNFFIYSNDDFLLTRHASPQDFYYPSGIAKVRLEPYGMVNGSAVQGQPDYLNGARNANELIEKEFQRSTTQLVTHSPQPLRKDVMQEIEQKFPTELKKTAHNRFRAVDDVALTGYLHAHYAILSGRAISDLTPVQLIQQNHNFKKLFSTLIMKKTKNEPTLPLSICLNDGANSHLNEAWNREVLKFLNTFYPEKSSFEK